MSGYGWRLPGTRVAMGDIGGDIQIGDSYSVRFISPDMPGSLITVSFYPVEYDQRPGEFVVQRQVEWLTCENPADPGGTETWSDYAYDDLSFTVMDSATEAGQQARQLAENTLADDSYFGWNGLSGKES